jgi:hypothetical protein
MLTGRLLSPLLLVCGPDVDTGGKTTARSTRPQVDILKERITTSNDYSARRVFAIVVCIHLMSSTGSTAPPDELWTFDRIDTVGGHRVTVLGHPHVIDTPVGKAVEFNGVNDAMFLDVHPLAGAETFTWEVIFRPDADGAPEQRFFHLQERDAKTGLDTQNRLLLEIRIIDGLWCLDSFAKSGDASQALMNRRLLHPAGAWYHVAMVYDGRQFRNYVDGVQEGSADLHLPPQGPGRSSAGVRINRVDYFKGAIRMARMTRRALSPVEFMKSPGH